MDTLAPVPGPTPVRRVLIGFYRLMLGGAALAVLAAFGCVVLGVAGRQFGFTVAGLDAYAGYAIATALFLALPETLRRSEHIRITLVLNRLPAGVRSAVQGVCLVLALVLSTALAWGAVRLVWLSHLTQDVSQASDATPLWIPQLAMALGACALAVACADALQAHLRGRSFFVPGRAAEDAPPAD
jgi:TRAP-type C4-dicarboxylate transport system permease small subunit